MERSPLEHKSAAPRHGDKLMKSLFNIDKMLKASQLVPDFGHQEYQYRHVKSINSSINDNQCQFIMFIIGCEVMQCKCIFLAKKNNTHPRPRRNEILNQSKDQKVAAVANDSLRRLVKQRSILHKI